MNEELIDQKNELQRKIYVLEWDKKKMQINPSLKKRLDDYKKELEEINAKLDSGNAESAADAVREEPAENA